MSDQKISQLTSLDNTTVAADDLLPIVDVSETGISRSKKITLQNLQDSPIAAISASITATAVDVFVYDTRKDSDGGAWRKRTQHTSWYNETLNTSTRGSRREFPAVAVIVAEATKVTIYDGDDPAMPMWMVWGGTLGAVAHFSPYSISAVYMLNGALFVTTNAGSGNHSMAACLFINDIRSYTEYVSAGWLKESNIANRNSSLVRYSDPASYLQFQSLPLNSPYNDVAMTVLPNAPIDAATGLPIPTIAVATDGGVSVIKDDGTVVDSAATVNQIWVVFDDDFGIWYDRASSTHYLSYATLEDYLAGDGFGDYVASTLPGVHSFDMLTRGNAAGDFNNGVLASGSKSSLSDSVVAGLMLHNPNYQDQSKGMSALLTSTYNTGWMNGDIKGAWLSDTDATNVTGAELVVASDFTDSSSGGSSITESSGTITGVYVAENCIYDHNGFSTVAGEKYTFSFNHISGATVLYEITEGFASSGATLGSLTVTDSKVYAITFTATGSTSYIRILNNQVFSCDSLSVRLADADRSVNNNGLQVFGTVTKTPVATGADLVAYSGFSASNYLEQPYNSDLDFGTGDFCVMGWVNVANGSAKQTVFSRYAATGGGGLEIYLDSLEKLQFRITANDWATAPRLESASSLAFGSWTHFCCFRSGVVMYTFLNGVLSATRADSGNNINNALASAFVGVEYSTSYQFDGSLALLRISATAPTAAQIAKIYEDEKVLFQDGAQATLYGASDAVTALAYDEDTNLLHVGTSAGRSDFQGLRRVANTTTAVGAAISASNSMIVEE